MDYVSYSEDDILKEIEKFLKTSDGKKIVSKYAEDVIDGKEDPGNTGIMTKDNMKSYAGEMISILREEAEHLPKSVYDHFSSLYFEEPERVSHNKDKDYYDYVTTIKFGDDLSRMSLEITYGKRKGERTGEGIDNIVDLFNDGYNASKSVYGKWNGHGNDIIQSTDKRKGLHFMEKAVERFNNKHMYDDVHATVIDV